MASVVAMHYGEALFELAKEEKQLQEIKQELLQVNQILKQEVELVNVLDHPKISKSEKKRLIKEVLPCSKLCLNFLCVLIDQGRFRILKEISEFMTTRINDEMGIEVAHVTSAISLSEDECNKIQKMLEKKTGKQIELVCTVDSSCIAGIRIRLKDEILDNTIATKLENMKERVAEATL